MKKLYIVALESADTTTSTDAFTAAQTRITANVKRNIRTHVRKNGLEDQFDFAARRISNVARQFQVYASPQVVAVIESLPGVVTVKEHPYLNRKNG